MPRMSRIGLAVPMITREIHAFYKQQFYKQRQAEIGKKLSKC